MYGWIAVNYLKGALCHAPHKLVSWDVLGTLPHAQVLAPALCSLHCGFPRAHDGHHELTPWSACAGFLAPSALPAPVIMQGKPEASRGEAASDGSATAAGSAADMGRRTVGTLDLGGSSLEVTFMPTGLPLQHATGEHQADLMSSKVPWIPLPHMLPIWHEHLHHRQLGARWQLLRHC